MNELLRQSQNQTSTVPAEIAFQPGEIFMNIKAFEAAQRMVKPLADSDLVPMTFQRKIGNCLIALETAQRIGASPLMVMQNLYIVHGKPAWSSQFLIACINASGKFSPLRYRMVGEKGTDSFGCVAWAKDKKDGEVLEAPEVTIGMAKREGWFTKNGSKWQTMPELMLRYRSATLFARTYAPELTMGIQTEEEVIDVTPIVTESRPGRFEAVVEEAKVDYLPESSEKKSPARKTDLEKLADLIAEKGIPVTAEQVKDYVEKQGEIFSFDMIKDMIGDIAEAIVMQEGK